MSKKKVSQSTATNDPLKSLHRRLRRWKITTIGVAALFIFSGGAAVYLGVSKSRIGTVNENSRTYYDKYMNFSLDVPYGWSLTTMKPKVESSDVSKSTGGLSFDMGQFSLQQEVAPVTLYVGSSNKGVPYKKYMIFDFRGSDQNYTYLKSPVNLANAFESQLKKIGDSDVNVFQVKKFNNKVMHGVLLQGSAKLKGTLYHYYRYFEPAGANILTITYGYTGTDTTAISDISNALSSLTYYRGGQFTASPFSLNNTTQSSSAGASGNSSTIGDSTSGSSGGIITKVKNSSSGISISNTPTTKK